MKKNNILSILEGLEKSVDTNVDFKWDEIKSPETEETFDKAKDTGDHKMAKGTFTGVKDKAPAKMETKPSFDKAKDSGVKGGAKQPNPKTGPVKMKESVSKLIEAIQKMSGKKVVLRESENIELSSMGKDLWNSMTNLLDNKVEAIEDLILKFNNKEVAINLNAYSLQCIDKFIADLQKTDEEFKSIKKQ